MYTLLRLPIHDVFAWLPCPIKFRKNIHSFSTPYFKRSRAAQRSGDRETRETRLKEQELQHNRVRYYAGPAPDKNRQNNPCNAAGLSTGKRIDSFSLQPPA